MPRALAPIVLLVEDDAEVAEIAADVLEVEGYVVITARDGGHALSILEATTPAAIVLDMMMPEVDGLAFLEAFANRPAPRPPVLGVSAFEDYLPLARAAGASATLRKPYSIGELVDRVGALVRGVPPRPSAAAAPPDETARLRAIFELALTEPAPDAALDAFVARVAALFEVPVALVSIVTAERQHWHSMCGLPPDLAAARGTPRSISFCTHAVVARSALVVADATGNALFRDNPLVRDRGVRFYAGVPLLDRLGNALGTLCLLDFRPRGFGHLDLELLSLLARRVVAELEWRERRRREGAPAAAFRHLTCLDEELGILGRDAFADALQIESLRAAARSAPLSLTVVALADAGVEAAVRSLEASFPSGHLGRLGAARIGVIAPVPAARASESARTLLGPAARIEGRDVPRVLGGAGTLLGSVEEALGEAGLAPARR